MTCQAVESGNVAEKYVRGLLADPERTAFEEHYFLCPNCLEELRLWRALQQAAVPVAERRPAANLYVWAAAAAVVAVILLFGYWRRSEPPAPVAAIPASLPVEPLQLLAAVEAPRYEAAVLRGTAKTAEQQFRAAMQAYSEQNYIAAADGLKAVLESDPAAVPARFYLGVCDLLLGNAGDAVAELRRAESAGATLYLEQIRFFLAKALIATHDLGGASRALESVVSLAGDRQAEARQLLDQLQALPKR
jgi:hypothetical protein